MELESDRKYAPVIGTVIINECLDRGYTINTSKLMKLLYYMQKSFLFITSFSLS